MYTEEMKNVLMQAFDEQLVKDYGVGMKEVIIILDQLKRIKTPIESSLEEKMEQIKQERDAAVNDLRGCAIESCAECMYCLYNTAKSFCGNCQDGSNWVYRGPKKED